MKTLRKKEPRPKTTLRNCCSVCLRLIANKKSKLAMNVMLNAVYGYTRVAAKLIGRNLNSNAYIPPLLTTLKNKRMITLEEWNRLTVLLMVMDGLDIEVYEENADLDPSDVNSLHEYADILKRVIRRNLKRAAGGSLQKIGVKKSHEFIAKYLTAKGFQVYPREMLCGSVGCPFERNRLVDVAAMKDGKLYAFEYKSVGDGLMRAVKQAENYRRSFDYVVLVAEVPRYDFSLNPTRGVRIKEFLRIGVGLWTVQFTENECIFTVVRDPLPQVPVPQNREWVMLKFRHNPRIMRKQPVNNKRLSDFA